MPCQYLKQVIGTLVLGPLKFPPTTLFALSPKTLLGDRCKFPFANWPGHRLIFLGWFHIKKRARLCPTGIMIVTIENHQFLEIPMYSTHSRLRTQIAQKIDEVSKKKLELQPTRTVGLSSLPSPHYVCGSPVRLSPPKRFLDPSAIVYPRAILAVPSQFPEPPVLEFWGFWPLWVLIIMACLGSNPATAPFQQQSFGVQQPHLLLFIFTSSCIEFYL